jgi:hypothetical protein
MFKKTLFIALIFLISSQVHAAAVTIVNPGFELTPGQSGGWTEYNPNGIGRDFGIYSPEAKTALVDDFYNPPGPIPPDLESVGFVYVGNDFGLGPVGLQQTLTSTLMANSQYNLSVAVGNPQSAFSPRRRGIGISKVSRVTKFNSWREIPLLLRTSIQFQ